MSILETADHVVFSRIKKSSRFTHNDAEIQTKYHAAVPRTETPYKPCLNSGAAVFVGLWPSLTAQADKIEPKRNILRPVLQNVTEKYEKSVR